MISERLYPLPLRFEKGSDKHPDTIVECSEDYGNGGGENKFSRLPCSLGVSVKSFSSRLDFSTKEKKGIDHQGTGKWESSTSNRLFGEGILGTEDRLDTMSILGSNNQTSNIGVEIQSLPNSNVPNSFSFSAYKKINDHEIVTEETFWLKLILCEQRFSEILDIIRFDCIESFYINLDVRGTKNIFVRPLHDYELRQEFKFLYSVSDIADAANAPPNTFQQEKFSNLKISITTNRRRFVSNEDAFLKNIERSDNLRHKPETQ